MNDSFRSVVFLIALLLLPAFGVYIVCGMIDFSASAYWPAIVWLTVFAVLALNNSHMLVCSIVALWPRKGHVSEMEHSGAGTDVLYVVRNETADLLFTTMSASLAGIMGLNAHLWLLSNSDDLTVHSAECGVISRLQEKGGAEKVSLFWARRNSLRRKHTGIHEWLEAHPEAGSIVICDADTILPPGSVEKLLRKAAHPDNAGIALFQSHIRPVDAETRFAVMLSFGQEIAQRIYARAHQRVFRRSAYYGSGCLIRAGAYRNAIVPAWVLSHDIWETVALEQHGWRVVFCEDVVTFGRFPPNMLDFMRRGRRWIVGTMESLPLLVLPGIPLGTRFLVLLPIYLYVSQPLLLIWIAIGFGLSSSLGPLLTVQAFALAGSGYVHLEMSSCLLFTVAIVFGHRFTQCRTVREVSEAMLELAASIVLCLNCILFDSVTVLAALCRRRRVYEWVRAEKQTRRLKLRAVAAELWLSTVVGVIATAVGVSYAFHWALIASPFLVSFCLGIPAAYWTAQRPGGNQPLR